VVSHVTQPLPSVPQLDSDAALHVAPEQQPVGHDAALHMHAPAEQTWPAEHGGADPHVHSPVDEHVSDLLGSQAAHPAPLTPHVANADGLHVEPEQHPLAQFVALHPLHVPEDVQVCGLGHAWHAPPPLPHALVVLPIWQVLLASQQPVGHESESQMHLPLEQS